MWVQIVILKFYLIPSTSYSRVASLQDLWCFSLGRGCVSSLLLVLLLLPFTLLAFGLSLGFAGAGFGDGDGLLALGVVQGLLQCPCPGSRARGCVAFTPAAKAILAVSSEVFLPVAGHFTLHLSGLLLTRALPEPRPTVSVARDTVAITPLGALRS